MPGESGRGDAREPWDAVPAHELREAVETYHRVYGLSLPRISQETGLHGTTIAHVMSGHTANPDDEIRQRLVTWLIGHGWTPKHTRAD